MKPILFYDDRSPPARSCLLLIKHLGLDIDLKFIDLFKREQFTEEFLKINPIHTVPTLKDGELILTDSHSILIYLCEKYAKGSDLYPEDTNQRIRIINLLFFECSVLFRRDSDLFSEIIRGELKDFERRKDKIKEAFTIIETFLQDHRYVAGDKLTIADISIITTLSTVDILVPVELAVWPRVFNWFSEMKSMPHYKEINDVGLNKLKDSLINFAKFDFKAKTS